VTAPRRFVIVGAGLAGAKAAETLRTEGFDGQVVLIGGEPHLPYERPPLSKDYLQGDAERSSVFVHESTWYDDHDIDVRVGTSATALDPAAREVVLADASRVPFDALLLATGSRPRILDVPGADLTGVHHLRTLDDADGLREGLARAGRVSIIGGGWIGLEVAAAARAAGVEVTVLEHLPLPLQRVLGPEVARVFADLHRAHGVDIRGGVTVHRLVADRGTLAGVELADGSRIEADLAVVGVGILPNVELAEDAGLHIDNGIRADQHLRTSDPMVFAAGDVANAYHPVLGRAIRVEHWANALHQGPVAARSMLGQDVSYSRLPYFYTDQYDLGMEYAGYAEPGGYDDVVIRGAVDDLRFQAFWLAGGRVRAGMHVNMWDSIEEIQSLIGSGGAIDTGRLADAEVPLSEL
jgi:3-phenylpropionate/trans-cinnamate dioxygenase ferredoxin reductase component